MHGKTFFHSVRVFHVYFYDSIQTDWRISAASRFQSLTIFNLDFLTVYKPTQVEGARPKWPLIRRVSSAHMFPVRSNYMVWKKLRAHFRLENGLELLWSGVTSVWNSSDQRRLRAHFERTTLFERTLVWSEVTSVWDGLIRGHTCLGRSDQGQFRTRPQPGN